jgi:hypothetical protein
VATPSNIFEVLQDEENIEYRMMNDEVDGNHNTGNKSANI